MLTVAAVVVGLVAGAFVPGMVERAPVGRGWALTLPRRVGWRDGALILAVASVWGVLAAVLEGGAELPAFLYLGWIGVALAAIDIRHHRLPDVLVLPSYPVALTLLGVGAIVGDDLSSLTRALAGGAGLAGFYYAIAFASPGGIGLGDVKLAGLLGLHLAWLDWTAVVVGSLAAFAAGALVALGLMATGRASRSSRLPFGPFMLAGAAIGIVIAV